MLPPHAARRHLALAASLLVTLSLAASAAAQAVDRIDVVRPDAPELAPYGAHDVGVRTFQLVDEGRPDVVNVRSDGTVPTYDRPFTVEVWHPADLGGGEPGGTYAVTTRDGATVAELGGRAVRDAAPDASGAPYPLVIVSHGYPGNRYLLAHLAENLASKGYVVASIDHADSTYADAGPFASTLYNRPLDQRFVLNELERLAAEDGALGGLLDADTTALVGYSMGGYGAVNAIGGGFTEASAGLPFAPPRALFERHLAGSDAFEARRDDRIRAAIAIAPWGMNAGFWDADGLAGIETPVLFMAGSVDDVAGYENGARAIFEGAVNAPRSLLTFVNANHNAAAPIPAPSAAWATGTYDHYADPVWDTVRMNNVAQHFATAFLGVHLRGDADLARYLDVVPDAADAVWSVDDDGA
ncbi:MAG: dienelactone hydrolase, partial [Trueperaceae bacterium]|nr:dienelactone hydrolase [Trueperaceae bacterium]